MSPEEAKRLAHTLMAEFPMLIAEQSPSEERIITPASFFLMVRHLCEYTMGSVEHLRVLQLHHEMKQDQVRQLWQQVLALYASREALERDYRVLSFETLRNNVLRAELEREIAEAQP